jgi:hypothetical protein
VEYLTTTPSEAKHPATPPQRDRSVWNYQVIRAEDGLVVLSTAEESGERKYEATFDWTGPRLRRVVRISSAIRDTIIDMNPAGAYIGWELRHRAIFDWPRFPIGAGVKHEFDFASWHVVETAAGSGDRLQTTMAYTDKRSDNYAEARRVVHTWDSASLWWLFASIEVEYTMGAQKSKEVLIEGRLIR